MRFRLLALLPVAALGACASQTFIDDVSLLRRHTKVVILANESGDGRVAVCPDLHGNVITSTATATGGFSFGRFDTSAPAGEDGLSLGGPLDSETYSVAKQTPSSVLLRLRTRVHSFEVEIHREILILAQSASGRLLGIQPEPEVRWVGYETRNKVTNAGAEPWKADPDLPEARLWGSFNTTPTTVVAIPVRSGPALILKSGAPEMAVGSDRSLGILGSYDPERGVLTVIQATPPPVATQAAVYVDAAVLETASGPLTLRPGASFTLTRRTFHFQGEPEALDPIARRVLGMSLEQIIGAAGKP